jgi:hypothetical protein
MKHRGVPMLCLAAVFLVCTLPVLGQNFEGTPAKTGQASFKFGSQDLTLKFVEGGFNQVQSFTMTTLIFRSEAKPKVNTHLNITLMYQAPGKLDLEGSFSMSGIGMFWDGSYSGYKKGKSKCTMTLTKATPTEVEGTAECPLLHDETGEVGTPLTNVKFSATTK